VTHHDEIASPMGLSEADTAKRQEDIDHIDILLKTCHDSGLWRELRRVRRHMLAELAAGTELPQTPDASTVYDFDILPRTDEPGGGWTLRLLEDGKEVGGGVFSLVVDQGAGVVWWNHLTGAERTLWLRRAPMPTALDAYATYRSGAVWRAASDAAGAWLDSRPRN
jgi:hypothetical protein